MLALSPNPSPNSLRRRGASWLWILAVKYLLNPIPKNIREGDFYLALERILRGRFFIFDISK
jgi:hypothetical protein